MCSQCPKGGQVEIFGSRLGQSISADFGDCLAGDLVFAHCGLHCSYGWVLELTPWELAVAPGHSVGHLAELALHAGICVDGVFEKKQMLEAWLSDLGGAGGDQVPAEPAEPAEPTWYIWKPRWGLGPQRSLPDPRPKPSRSVNIVHPALESPITFRPP